MPKAKKPPKRLLWVTLLAVLVAAGLIGVSIWSLRPPADQKKAPPRYYVEGTTKGPPNAKVTIIEYSDFQCFFCKRFWEQTLPQLKKAYVETGKVRFIYKTVAFLGEKSQWAAEAAKCAAEQNRFWEYHDHLFQKQGLVTFSKANLKRFARELNLDTRAFDECLDLGRYAEAVRRETEEAKVRGVIGVPTFFINGRKLQGVRSFDELRNIIEEELKK